MHSLDCPFANGQIAPMIAERERSIPLGCEGGIKQKPGLRFRPGFFRLARQLQCSPQVKISPRRVRIGVYTAPQPLYRLVILFRLYRGDARKQHPKVSEGIERAQAKRFLDMTLGFLTLAKQIFC